MKTYPNGLQIPYAPTETTIFYPETDGKPMAASDEHRQQLIWILQVLEAHFAEHPEVYISGDIMMYYVEGSPRKVVSPDVLVTFGIGQKRRLTYKVWEEGKAPDFVMEFSSKSTYQNDLTVKMELYASLGIQNYFLYDAEGLYLPAPLMGFELVDGMYVPVPSGEGDGFRASVLDLDFHIPEAGLRIYDPVAGEWLRTRAETAEARAETAEARAETAEARAETAEAHAAQESIAKQKAESEAAQLREELARLQARR